MGQFEIEIALLRARRQPPDFVAWFRSLRPFDRRSVREPGKRDVYWVNIQRRLAESDAAFLLRHEPYGSSDPADR